jgi:hypothetical protein
LENKSLKLGLLKHLIINYRNYLPTVIQNYLKGIVLRFLFEMTFKKKLIFSGVIEKLVTPVDTGSLGEGDCKQQPSYGICRIDTLSIKYYYKR